MTQFFRTALPMIGLALSTPVAAQSPWETEIWAGYGLVMTDWFAVQAYSLSNDSTTFSSQTLNAAELQGLGVRLSGRARSIGPSGGIKLLGAGLSAMHMRPLDDADLGPEITSFGGAVEGGLGYVFDRGLEAMIVVGLGVESITADLDGEAFSGLGYSTRVGGELGWNFESALLTLGVHRMQTESLGGADEISYRSQVYTGSVVWWF